MTHWTTNYRGTQYALTDTGQLRPLIQQEHEWQQHDCPRPMIHQNEKRSSER